MNHYSKQNFRPTQSIGFLINFFASINALQSTLGGSVSQAMAFFESSLNAQAAMLGLNDIFWLSAVIFIAIIPLIWITKLSKDAAAAAAGAGGHQVSNHSNKVSKNNDTLDVHGGGMRS
jgi:hypothetical protein